MERFTALFEQDGDRWLGFVGKLPGANTQGWTLDAARDHPKGAVPPAIAANREILRSDRSRTEPGRE